MEQPIFQVDSFSDVPFRGNPAGVCPLESPKDPQWMQSVAAEMNLAETAFFHPEGDAFHLRWFTPTTEVALCGHATLASAHILWETKAVREKEIRFSTKSGILRAFRGDGDIQLDFPALLSKEAPLPDELRQVVGTAPNSARLVDAAAAGEVTYIVELTSETEVREFRPNLDPIRYPGSPGVIVTARAEAKDYDFVSRFFVPGAGIDEDPVTGFAHCCLAPFWCERLSRASLTGYQASARGGIVGVRLDGDRVRLSGKAITVLQGTLLA